MNISQIEENIKSLVKKIDKESFIYDMLLAYGTPKSTITKVKKFSKNLSKNDNEVVIKKKIFFAHFDKDVDKEFEKLRKDPTTNRHDPRFLIVTDYKTVMSLDTKLDERVEFSIKELSKKFDFFLPLAGIEKKEFKHENPVDVKAAEKLAKLFDLIKKDNPKNDPKSLHSLNVFLTRLLFCYFAEDTEIFPQGLFTYSVSSHTEPDGSNLGEYLSRVFKIMNLQKRPKDTPDFLNKFPYVNGGLFAEDHSIPKFTKKSREALLDIGDLNWAEINPDIFGSMIQAVVHPDQRAGLGMHYTSVSNIMKVIEPLFLNNLFEEFEKSKNSKIKLYKLRQRISKIKVFDPACGSGNFLIIAYKELRLLEMKILKELNEIPMSGINLSNFYGLEVDDFAHEVAILSLWLAEHQMDVVFAEEFGEVKASLPLKEGGSIVCENSLRVDWEDICPISGDEIYVIGNPPYVASKNQTKEHKEDIKYVLEGISNTKSLDYIACWFIKSANYLDANVKVAFVTTNSICQGTQVSLLWPHVLKDSVEIFFCHKDFLWTNNAKNKAGVTCSIIGLQKKSKNKKFIYSDGNRIEAKRISPYLIDGKTVYIGRQANAISSIPRLQIGNEPYDGGFLTFQNSEMEEFVRTCPKSRVYFKKLVGSSELMRGTHRWCLWISDDDVKEASKIPEIRERINKVKELRENGGMNARSCAHRSHQFRWVNRASKTQIVIPVVSSERRNYIPMAFFDNETIISNAAQVIFDPEPFIFTLLMSKMHMAWVRTVTGRLKTDFRYNGGQCYNTFPVPGLADEQKRRLEELAFEVISIRERFPEKSLADLYDPDKTPSELLEVHSRIDEYVDSIYRKKMFMNDVERLSRLFDLYEHMTEGNDE